MADGGLTIEQQQALALARARMRAAQASPSASPDDGSQSPDGSGFWGGVQGAAGALGSGLYTGLKYLAGGPQDMVSGADALIGSGVDAARNFMFGPRSPEEQKRFDATVKMDQFLPNTQDVSAAVDPLAKAVTPKGFIDYQPKNFAEKVMQTGASFAPAAALSPGSATGNLVKFAAAPAAASEAAGAVTKGSKFEPYARAMAAITGGGLAAWLGGPGVAAQALKARLPAGTSGADIDAAEQLITSAAGRGVGLTWPEALAKVTNGRVDVTDLQRFLEGSQASRPIMTDFMANRPEMINQAVQSEFGNLTQGATLTDPVSAGLKVQKIAGGAIDRVRQQINAVTRPLYTAAGPQVIPTAQFNLLNQEPLFRNTLAQIRKDPVYQTMIAGYPDNSVQALDAVKKFLDDEASKAGRAGANYAAGRFGSVASDAKSAAVGVSPEYQQALAKQADLRQRFLAPAEAGPLGKMAETDNLQAQARALLPAAPSEGSQRVVTQTVRRLAGKDPDAAFQLIRDYLSSTFSEASQATRTGPNAWGGANWAGQVRGNLQQAANLEAAVRALPGGNIRWDGLNELLDIMEATGKRQAMGSPTQANQALSESLKTGTPVGAAATLAASPGKVLTYGKDMYEDFRLGKNTERLAQMITDPAAAPLLKRLLNAKTASDRESAARLALYYLDQSVNRGASPPAERP
jgi:hypothetical protein